jgi:sugar/nucleoside kinase (ribokinase family)
MMTDVVGLGSALMDFTIEVEPELLEKLGLKKGHMHLIDAEQSADILTSLSTMAMAKTPGGSAANTIAGVANFGGKAVFLGKVGRDAFGDFYKKESEKAGVTTRLARHEKMTGHAIALITPDSERTFATHLGAALFMTKEDVPEEEIRKSRILHLEGYMLEGGLRDASLHAMEMARRHRVKISIDLADPALVRRNLDEFRRIMKEYADIIFANEEEAAVFTGLTGEETAAGVASYCSIAAVKFGADGSIIVTGGKQYRIPPYKTAVVNTNGAGDMYAAGVLYGIARDLPIDRAGRIGSQAASIVVSQIGARLKSALDASQMGI